MDLQTSSRIVWLVLAIPAILYLGRPILLPIALAAVLAMVLTPLVHWFRRRGLREGLSIAAAALVLVLFVVLVIALVTLQVAQVVNDWPEISKSLEGLQRRGEAWLVQSAGVPADTVRANLQRVLSQSSGVLAGFFGTLAGALAMGFITFVFVILMLAERARLHWVATRLAPANRRRDAAAALADMVGVAHEYLVGKLKVMGIMAVVYFAAFSLAGVPYAPFLALLIALSSLVPFVGNLAGGAIAVILALAASGGTAALTVLGVLVLAQGLENYVLEPKIVGGQLGLNPLMTIFAVFAFGALWGVVGAVIALPLTGMIKVALQRAPGAEPAVALMTEEEIAKPA